MYVKKDPKGKYPKTLYAVWDDVGTGEWDMDVDDKPENHGKVDASVKVAVYEFKGFVTVTIKTTSEITVT